jgi:lipid-binding SYLF domain-containing protein
LPRAEGTNQLDASLLINGRSGGKQSRPHFEKIIALRNLFFGVGEKYGRGYASCRHGAHGWSSPAAVAIEGGSFGLQLGGSSTDVIMLVMNQNGMNPLLGDKFILGGEAAAAGVLLAVRQAPIHTL